VQVGGHDHGWMEKEIVLMDWYSGWILGCLHMHVDLFATIYWDQLHGSKQCIQWYLDLPTTGNLKSKPKIWYLKACAYVYNTHINIRWYTIYDYIYIWYLHDIQYMVIYCLIYIYIYKWSWWYIIYTWYCIYISEYVEYPLKCLERQKPLRCSFFNTKP
jgi:hypothetical protein